MGIFDNLGSIWKILRGAGRLKDQKKIHELEEENITLKEQLKIKENLKYENNAYWIEREGGQKDGPFCPRCWDKNKELIRLNPCGNPAYCDCPECKNRFQIRPDQPVHTEGGFDSFI